MLERSEPLIALFVTRPVFSIRSFAFLVVALSLMVRAAIPAGWMPSGERAFEVKICAGVEMTSAWLSKDGTLHKSDPSKKSHSSDEKQDCAFAGFASHAILDDAGTVALAQLVSSVQLISKPTVSSIGQGLAAPPPPSTGPPVLI